MIVSRGSLTVAVEQCHHRDAASSISAFLTLAVTDLVTTGKFILPTPPTTFSFPLWSRTFLCSIIAGNFLFALLAEGIAYTAPAEYCFTSHAISVSHSLLNLLVLLYAAFPHLDALAD